MKFTPKKVRNIFWFIVIIVWVAIFINSYEITGIDWSQLVRHTGRMAWYLLTITIALGLFRKIFSFLWLRRIFSIRKHIGIFAFLVATTHFLFEISKRYLNMSTEINEFIKLAFSSDHAMIFGSLAYLFMLPALLTSTNYAVIKIGAKKWKIIQRLVHISFLLAGLHFTLIQYFIYIDGKINVEPVITLTVYVVSYILLLFFKRNKSDA